jgi:hypothetical protein
MSKNGILMLAPSTPIRAPTMHACNTLLAKNVSFQPNQRKQKKDDQNVAQWKMSVLSVTKTLRILPMKLSSGVARRKVAGTTYTTNAFCGGHNPKLEPARMQRVCGVELNGNGAVRNEENGQMKKNSKLK